jgi:hypothetical protein
MVGCFPDPYPDELLYSVCARFQERMRFPNKKSTRQALFCTVNRTAAIDFPCNLEQLLETLPPRHRYEVKQIIDDHTMLPLFSHFLPGERVATIREDMRGPGGLVTHKRAGVMASRVPSPTWLRFCPLCMKAAKRKPGETYWHRIHQLQGVEVCPTHKVFLENSNARRVSTSNPLHFVSAENATRVSAVRHLNLQNRTHQILLRIAKDARWLLDHSTSGTDLSDIYNRYLNMLAHRGLATFTGSIKVTKLLDEFQRFYPIGLLKHLRCEFSGRDQVKTNWLLRLARPPKHACHPLYHLLLMQFLKCTPEEFFRLPTELNIFGEAPWPCLNPAAEHFRELVISECTLSSRLRGNRPTATFSCRCGFAYARSGPDSSPQDRFRIGRMVNFGLSWEAKLKKLWKNSSLSLTEVGRQLGVDPLTVRRHAARLKLHGSRSYRRSTPLNCTDQLNGTRDSTAHIEKRRNCRATWISATRHTPKITLKALRLTLPREYAWLLHNDGEWLKRHVPRQQNNVRSTSSVDWKKRDAEYAVAVKTAAARLKNDSSRPVQVTRTAISKIVGAVALLRQKLHKLPLTAQVLAKLVENHLEFAVRRIRWAAKCFTRDRVIPHPWQLISRANAYRYRNTPEVKNAVAAAMDLIEFNSLPTQQLTA